MCFTINVLITYIFTVKKNYLVKYIVTGEELGKINLEKNQNSSYLINHSIHNNT